MQRTELSMPMRDGIVLAADLFSSDELKARPVILERTPYGRRDIRTSDGNRRGEPLPTPEFTSEYFVKAGYHVVRQDCRGRGDSGGAFVKYLNESEDGADSLEWIASQSWCDGRVFTMGVSYSAHTQLAAASETPAGLAGMFLDSGGFASAYESGMRQGGAFELKQLTWAVDQAADDPGLAGKPEVLQGLRNTDVAAWFSAIPWRAGVSPLRDVPGFEAFILEQWRSDVFDDYWKLPAIYARGSYDKFPDVPSLHMSSWYDPYARSAIENFTQLGARKSSPAYLVLGPWTHGYRCLTYAGDVDFGEAATLDGNIGESYLEFRRRWFDAHLAEDPGAAGMPPVQYFLMGGGTGERNSDGRLDHGGRWCEATQWPPPEATQTDYFLRANGLLTPHRDRGESGFAEYDFDPKNPVPTMGGQVTSGEPVMEAGAYNQVPDERFYGAKTPYLPLTSRPDVVSFETEPLEEDTRVAGSVNARLFISSSAVDTDFTIKLVDVYPPSDTYPNGFAMNLTEGIFRCRFHESYEYAAPLQPDEIYEIVVGAPDTANLFAKGHRIRIDVSSSDFPRFDVNSNTGLKEVDTRRTVIATNRIHFDAEHPSALQLWIFPAS